jgi:predicted RNase H-like HicB family nuclease
MTPINPAIQFLAAPWTWSINHDPDGDCWVATIKELPDFFAAGKTSGEAALNAREAFISHISGYLATGTPIPTPHNPGVLPGSTGTENAQLIEVAA